MMFGKNKESNQEYTDGKYSIVNLSGEKGTFKRITSADEGICIVPFDTNPSGQVKNLYLCKYQDYLSNSNERRCLTCTFDKNKFDSYYDAVLSCIKDELGIDSVPVNEIFYLGKIKHTHPFTKNYSCFAINLTNYSDEIQGFSPNLSHDQLDKKPHTIEKVKFSRIVKGEISDSLALACSTLLLSYLQD